MDGCVTLGDYLSAPGWLQSEIDDNADAVVEAKRSEHDKTLITDVQRRLRYGR